MAQLLVRGLADDTVLRLRERAQARGRSAEAEHRAILEAALAPRTTRDWIEALQSGPLAEVDDEIWRDILDRRDTGRPVEL
jgi:plasmid stability protein